MNIVILAGNLGADAEKKVATNGTHMVRLRVATTSRYKDSEGEWQEVTDWHSCTLWGNRAKALAKYLTSGTKVTIRGALRTRSWEDDDGNKRYSTEVTVEDIFLGGSPKRKEKGKPAAEDDDEPYPSDWDESDNEEEGEEKPPRSGAANAAKKKAAERKQAANKKPSRK